MSLRPGKCWAPIIYGVAEPLEVWIVRDLHNWRLKWPVSMPPATVISNVKCLASPLSAIGATYPGIGEIWFFSYRDDGGKQIRFILGRDRVGKVAGAFDACQQCSQYRKGYTSSRGYLVCRICGNRYPLVSRAGVGSCAPIGLTVQDSGKTVTVETRQLKEHAALF